MMRTRFIAVSALAASAILMAGCALHGKPPVVATCKDPSRHADRPGPALVGLEYGEQASPMPLDSIQYSNWPAARSVSIQHLYSTRTPTNTVQLTARWISCADAPVRLLVRTSFLRKDQSPAEPVSAWRSVIVQPRLTAQYTEWSTSTDVSDFMVEVMPAP